MNFRTLILVALLAVGVIYAGSISGTVSYSGTETGMIVVACLEEGTSEIDLMSTPATTIDVPGAYTITGDTLVDGMNYWCMSLMLIGMSAESGNPAGIHPSVVNLIDGSATGVDITLATSGNIGGTITYSGDPLDICINVYDAYGDFTGDTIVLEETYYVGTADYSITDIPSGPKMIQAFADTNDNDIWDAGEPSAYYSGPFGEMVLIGGGGLFDDIVDITITTGIDESAKPNEMAIRVVPNPFNASCRIDAPGRVDIFDMNGHLVNSIEGGSVWNGTDEAGNHMPTGLYLARASLDGRSKTAVLVLAK